ncbi:helix-turn-helix domain-containing protein [Streptomyces syringium]|uniref:helix-turn-helix domain-containing protein n=1 Tax=Streptomyces syringium TaxID=76729 RepID=UPI003F57D367
MHSQRPPHHILIRNALVSCSLTVCECSGGGARTWSPDAQEAVRLLAVSALVEGRDRVEVAALFKVSVRAMDNWWVRWQAGGPEGPPDRRPALGPPLEDRPGLAR